MKAGNRMIEKVTSAGKGRPVCAASYAQASWVHIQYDENGKRIYEQIVSRNPKKKKVAIVAIMRRLAVRLWHRMRKAELAMA